MGDVWLCVFCLSVCDREVASSNPRVGKMTIGQPSKAPNLQSLPLISQKRPLDKSDC